MSPRGVSGWRAFGLVVPALLYTFGCGVGDEPAEGLGTKGQAILGGVADSSHAHVAYLNANRDSHCSAVLIAEDWVVTAAHCVAELLVDGETDTSVGAELPYEKARFAQLFFNGRHDLSEHADEGERYEACEVLLHPEFGVKVGQSFGPQYRSDVALLRLCRAVVGVSPAALAPTIPTMYEAVTLVGYGPTSNEGFDSGARRVAQNEGLPVKDRPYFYFLGPGNACPGDSGGAAFVTRGGRELLAGVITNANCHWEPEKAVGIAQSVGAPTCRDWIEATLAAGSATPPVAPPSPEPSPSPDPGLGFIGDACDDGAGCESGQCFTEADNLFPAGMCTERCTRTCPDAPGKSVTFCIGVQSEGVEQGYCVSRCDFDLFPLTGCRAGYLCPEAAYARFNQSDVLRRVCVPEGFEGKADRGYAGISLPGELPEVAPTAGCSAGAGRSPGPLPLLLLALIYLARRRH